VETHPGPDGQLIVETTEGDRFIPRMMDLLGGSDEPIVGQSINLIRAHARGRLHQDDGPRHSHVGSRCGAAVAPDGPDVERRKKTVAGKDWRFQFEI
jgi:hypothetical protein